MNREICDITVIGGGASGMAAAIAARRAGTSVTIIERQARVGKKLLSSGNGRCNLLNVGSAEGRYHGENPSFAVHALNKYTPERILSFFDELGLVSETEYGGRVYPFSNHASAVLDVLRAEMDFLGINLQGGKEAGSARKDGDEFIISCGDEEFRSRRLIIACGGCAGAKVGGVSLGYELLKSFGHGRTSLLPALAGIKTAGDFPKALKGIKLTARCTLFDEKGRELKVSEGDVIFSEDGLSGTAIFDLARFVPPGKASEVVLNLIPGKSEEDISSRLFAFSGKHPDYEADTIFTGILHRRAATVLCKAAGIRPSSAISELDAEDIMRLVGCALGLAFKVKGLCGFDTAQVTAGGMKTSEFNPATMESCKTSGLYACGEVLDIDGDCGGFNLRWAWASGFLAGESAVCSLK